jgi:hypothetical protein
MLRMSPWTGLLRFLSLCIVTGNFAQQLQGKCSLKQGATVAVPCMN